MRDAYHTDSALAAEAKLTALAIELDKKYPGAAASLREGMDETLTILRLDVPPTLARTLRSTNPIESMISICRDHATNVKNWQDGQMALRWCAAGMAEAAKQFRRVNGFMHLKKLRAALEEHVADQNTASTCYNKTSTMIGHLRGRSGRSLRRRRSSVRWRDRPRLAGPNNGKPPDNEADIPQEEALVKIQRKSLESTLPAP